MDFSDMYGEVDLHLGSHALATEARRKDWVNRVYTTLATVFRFHELEGTDTSITTVDGTVAYTTPSGVKVIRTIRDLTNEVKLEARDIDWLETQDDTSDAKGVPEFWVRYGSQLLFQPMPDGAYNMRIRYWKTPTALSTDSDETIMPEEWDNAVILLAASMGAFILGLDRRGMNLKSEGLGVIKSIPEDFSKEQMKRLGQFVAERRGHGG